jgi:hypothetical protein
MNWAQAMISAAMALVNWALLLEVFVIAGVMLTIFRMQTAEQLERIVGCDNHHGVWGLMRRSSSALTALAMLWCAIYGLERDWQPWPPIVLLIVAVDFHALVSIMIMRQDIQAQRAGTRRILWRQRRRTETP